MEYPLLKQNYWIDQMYLQLQPWNQFNRQDTYKNPIYPILFKMN